MRLPWSASAYVLAVLLPRCACSPGSPPEVPRTQLRAGGNANSSDAVGSRVSIPTHRKQATALHPCVLIVESPLLMSCTKAGQQLLPSAAKVASASSDGETVKWLRLTLAALVFLPLVAWLSCFPNASTLTSVAAPAATVSEDASAGGGYGALRLQPTFSAALAYSQVAFVLGLYLSLLCATDALAFYIAERFGGYPWQPAAVALIVEMLKFSVSIMLLCGGGASLASFPLGIWRSGSGAHETAAAEEFLLVSVQPRFWTWLDASLAMAPVALLYAANNTLVLFVLSKLQIGAFAAWRNASILLTAILWVFKFNTQLPASKTFGVLAFFVGSSLLSAAGADDTWSPAVWLQVLVAISSLLSALASVLFESVLKSHRLASRMGVDRLCALLYFETALVLGGILVTRSVQNDIPLMEDFRGIDRWAVMLALVQAACGIAMSRVLVYADSVARVMAGGPRELLRFLLLPLFGTASASSSFTATSAAGGALVALSLVAYARGPADAESAALTNGTAAGGEPRKSKAASSTPFEHMRL
eukprot:TRINITY_DN27106_c0_g1_i1.p1 TRINITY_DN27106_c0_g1~~TRINITY_DN27106_c0_g1_i1.p1  ORF type:complete len:533 (-),score=109.86 TRINITY_DN27106_c0_g1_i1:73-1671(-)